MLPSWVEPDPLRGRAVDALGLQATADAIAERLIPELSVLTTRARYFALLAWARRACEQTHDEYRIHRLEVALAVREALIHRGAMASERCRFVGSRNLGNANLDAPPPDPNVAYRQPVWRAYRAAMQKLGFLDDGYALTSDGIALGKRFAAACAPRDSSGRTMLPASACLSRMSKREAALLASRLGVEQRGKLADGDTSPRARRCATWRTLQPLFDEGLALPTVLARYEASRLRAPSFTVAALREAAIWERLSVGLNAAFLLFLKHVRRPAAARMALAAARRRPGKPAAFLDSIPIDDHAAIRAIASVRHALALRKRLEPGALVDSDESAFELGQQLVGGDDLDLVFAGLVDRHLASKGDDAWVRPRGHGLELARDPGDTWTLPTKATLHGYRVWAFGQILVDLRWARKAGA